MQFLDLQWTDPMGAQFRTNIQASWLRRGCAVVGRGRRRTGRAGNRYCRATIAAARAREPILATDTIRVVSCRRRQLRGGL